LSSGASAKYRIFISRHQSNDVFLPLFCADSIILSLLWRIPVFPAMSGRIHPGLSGNFLAIFLVNSHNRAESIVIKQVKYDGILDFFIFFGLFSLSGKLIIFLYPFPSTGE
jgi:hypothetical protein